MSIESVILNEYKFKYINELHKLNILFIFVTFPTSKFDKFKQIKSGQLLNIPPMSETLEVSIFDIFTDINLMQ